MRIGIDVGGTFTDMVLIDDQTGRIFMAKVLTTPKNLAEGVITGIEKTLRLAAAAVTQVDYLVHGTTIGTNALIERKGACTGLITTAGFRDVLEIGRVQRPAAGLYDFTVDNPDPLVPRHLRTEATERVGADGSVVTPLDEDSARAAAACLKEQKVESIAISFLFSFLNPAHERRVREIVQDVFPAAYVSISSEIAPEFREYERTSTVVINAYLQPILSRYLDNLEHHLQARWGQVDLRIMQASGGAISAEAAKEQAVRIVNSGPAGGAVAGAFVGELTGDRQLISVDMGGTSFDIGVIDQGVPRVTSEGVFEGFPVKIPIVDVHAIGAGGGSIAWLDKGGALNVGPMSAGASPGPACYGLGGVRPTVTDANLILGRLNPAYFLGGEMPLYPDLARQALQEHVAGPLGMSVEDAAYGIIRVVNANMVKGISVSSIEKGYDVREFALVAFGGAGPVHAVEIAADVGMRRVVIPPYAGALSAFGLLVSDTRHDYVQTVARLRPDVSPADLLRGFQELEARGLAQLRTEGAPEERIELVWSADLRYEGQSYELNTPVTRKGTLAADDVAEIVARFNEMHQRIYAYSSVDEEVEFVNIRLTAIGHVPPVRLARRERVGPDAGAALKGHRPVYFPGPGFVSAAVYERDRLAPGNVVKGPCLIEEVASTTVMTPEATGEVDEYGNILIHF